MFIFPKSDIQTLCPQIFQIKNTQHVEKLLLRKQFSACSEVLWTICRKPQFQLKLFLLLFSFLFGFSEVKVVLYMYTMGTSSAKKNQIVTLTGKCLKLQFVIIIKISQTQSKK